jgi:hypothetical protein
MYVIDHQDRVVELSDLPQSSVGAPSPVVLAADHLLIVAFFVEDTPADCDGEPAAAVRFERPYASYFGPPNDETFSSHPLAARGLRPYGAFEVVNSSWVRSLEKMNSVHPHHRPERFAALRHVVLSFHDTTFECVSAGYSYEFAEGPLDGLVANEARGLSG